MMFMYINDWVTVKKKKKKRFCFWAKVKMSLSKMNWFVSASQKFNFKFGLLFVKINNLYQVRQEPKKRAVWLVECLYPQQSDTDLRLSLIWMDDENIKYNPKMYPKMLKLQTAVVLNFNNLTSSVQLVFRLFYKLKVQTKVRIWTESGTYSDIPFMTDIKFDEENREFKERWISVPWIPHLEKHQYFRLF